jgi:alkylation response protein AidB-like acyl-CoA dehydrogenase
MSIEPAFPRHDPVGADDPAQQADVESVARILGPTAAGNDRHGVHRETIDHLAAAGMLGSPRTPPGAQRDLAETISGCDATAWFCWVQHQSPLRLLEEAVPSERTPGVGELRESLLPELRAGRQLAAVAFAHLRRPGPANPSASRVEGGWSLVGSLDWVTSWDIADVVMIMAQGTGADSRSVVCAFLPAGHSAASTSGVEPGLPLALLSMGGTHTRPVVLTDAFVSDAQVVALLDRDEWLAADAVTSANPNPSAFGVARGAIAELDLLAQQRGDQRLAEVVTTLIDECRATRRAAYAAIDDPGFALARRLGLRAASLDLALRAATAVVIARAGAAMRSGHEAERRIRDALFLQVQAQTAATRAASLDLILERSRTRL